MHPPYRYFNVNAMPIIALFLIGHGPWIIAAAFILCFVIHSLIDQWLFNSELQDKIYLPKLAQNYSHQSYNIPLYFSVLVQLVVTINAVLFPYQNTVDAISAGLVAGMAGGIMGMSAGHELIHRREQSERILGLILLHSINYAYFSVEHLWHHIHVATDEDVDSAKEGQSLYSFILKVLPEGYLTSWRWQTKRSQMLTLTLIQLCLYTLIYFLAGHNGIIVYTLMGLVSVIFLKWADYVEHYGLRRKMINGKAENIAIQHAWDCKNSFTNIALFNLAEHSPHHTNGRLFYYELNSKKESPNTLPYGHTTLMLKSLFPKHWMNFMQPYIKNVEKYYYSKN